MSHAYSCYMAKKLTDKQCAAVDHWVGTVPSSRTYVSSYIFAYNVAKASPQYQRREACRLFKLPHVVEYLTERMFAISKRELDLRKQRQEHVEVDAAYVLHKAWLLTEFSLRRFIKIEPETGLPYYDFRAATDDDWWCIDEMTIDTVTAGRGKARLYVDKVKIRTTTRATALKLIGEHVKVAAFGTLGARGAALGDKPTSTRLLQPAERISRIEHLLALAEQREKADV